MFDLTKIEFDDEVINQYSIHFLIFSFWNLVFPKMGNSHTVLSQHVASHAGKAF